MRTNLRLSVAAVALLLAACTSSTTSITGPSADKCQVSASNSPGSFTANGGSGTVTIAAARDCAWSLSTDAPWISVGGPASGQGGASVAFSVQANQSPAARSGAIVVGSDRLGVNQAGAPCRFTISRTADAIDAAGGRLAVDVSTLSGCSWKATSAVAWIAIVSGQSGTNSGTVVLAVAANGGAERVGSVNVAGQNYTVTQAAKPVSPSPTPSPTPPPPGPVTAVFTGSISNVSGKCPVVSFVVNNVTVVTSASTAFQHGDCGDLRAGVLVSGSGTVQANNSILATTIAFQKD